MLQSNPIKLAAISTVVSLFANAALAIPAFSGAEGPGANATGGRGGDVYHVTNLEFDLNGVIPGSFKYGINNAPTAGRTIVFDVGGTIFQNGGGSGQWFRSGKSNITIAGQTAPGAGITIAGVASKFTGNNVVLRNITVRPNKDPVNPTSFTYDAVSTQLTNSIVDHVSASWFSDEGISQTDAGFNTTVQYSLIAEGLNYNGHSYGSIINTQVNDANLSFHHNVYANNNSRNPRLGSETGTGAITNFTNNVIYNWVSRAGYSALNANTSAQEPSRTNIVNNYYIVGPSNGATVFLAAGDQTQIYQNGGNKKDANKNGVIDGAVFGWSEFSGPETQSAGTFNVAQGVVDNADVALQRSLDYGGANWANRNAIEQRIVNSVRNGTGTIINDLTAGAQAGEWATVMSQRADAGGNAPFTRAADFDTDQDGIPNLWESAHGLDPAVASNNGDFDSDGYTNLEEYINELSEWPAPRPIVFNNALDNNRYARIENWDINWQPSRFDTAVINNGATAVVDAVGQHAGTLQINTGGAVNVNGGWIAVAARTNVTGGATLTVSGGDLISGVLSVNGGGLTKLAAGTNVTPRVGAIEAASGKVDIADNGIVVDYTGASSLANVKQLITTAHNGGAWDGNGVTTSSATLNRGVGYAEASEVLGITGAQTALFRGQIVDATSVLVVHTLYGDSNLDGTVNITDFARLAASFNQSGGWSNGDSNYDGQVNISDFAALAANFNQSLPLARTLIPEPIGALVLSISAVVARRRR